MTYLDFLKTKIEVAPVSGFAVPPEEIHPALKPHQRDAVCWALSGGRRALFESFGLGKTVQELEYCRQVLRHEGGKALIVLPLGVRQEFTHDAVQLLGVEPPRYITAPEQAAEGGRIYMTNYERVRDGDIDPEALTVGAAYARGMFSDLWDSTLVPGERTQFGWEANPRVWVIAFRRVEQPEDWA